MGRVFPVSAWIFLFIVVSVNMLLGKPGFFLFVLVLDKFGCAGP